VETYCYQYQATSRVQADFQGMIELNVDLWDVKQKVGFNIQMVGQQQCGFMLSDDGNLLDSGQTQLICLLADKKELTFDTGA
jgi:hypothetical protein